MGEYVGGLAHRQAVAKQDRERTHKLRRLKRVLGIKIRVPVIETRRERERREEAARVAAAAAAATAEVPSEAGATTEHDAAALTTNADQNVSGLAAADAGAPPLLDASSGIATSA